MSSSSPFAAVDWKSLDGPKLLETLQTLCVQVKISDIHASPDKQGVRLSVRLYGVLTDISELTHAAYEDLIRRVKFVAKMKLNITDVPQDGHYTFPMEKKTVAFRVSTIPSRFGEALTIRVLDPERGIVPLQKLGLPQAIQVRSLRDGEVPIRGDQLQSFVRNFFISAHYVCGPRG